MSFCIYCWSKSPAGAVFCLSCGQLLYEEPQVVTVPKTVPSRCSPLLIIAFVLAIAMGLGLILWERKPASPTRPSTEISKEGIGPAPLATGPVLTVIGLNRGGSVVSQGSGFILTPDGLAGSNYHVLKGAFRAVAQCCGGRELEVRSIEGADLKSDLVVFQLYDSGSALKPTKLPHVTLGSSKGLAVGDKLIAIGSPQGLENSVSDGILSAIRDYDSVRLLQITAPISPGSSGGPILDQSGRVVGVATFQFDKGQNLNFAVATEHLIPLMEEHFGVTLGEFQSIVAETKRTKRPSPKTGGSEIGEASVQDQRPEVRHLTGQYGGTVHNSSANLSAQFWIILRDDYGSLTGCMGVLEPLWGSGPLYGYLDGDQVHASVTSAIGVINITGQLGVHHTMSGTYTVEHAGQPPEQGNFTLQKISTEGPSANFDPTKCPTDAEVHKEGL